MQSTERTPARDKYREAQFFRRKLDRADDGHVRNAREHLDKDEFRFYYSAFTSAVTDLHSHVDGPAFAEWADDTGRGLHRFFEQRCQDVVTVQRSFQSTTAATADGGGQGTTSLAVGTRRVTYCVPDPEAVPESLRGDDDTVAISDLAARYLDQIDTWLSELESNAAADS